MAKSNLVCVVLLSIFIMFGFINLAYSQTNTAKNNIIVHIVDVEYIYSVAWGDIYSCKIKEVLQKEISDTIITLYVSCCKDSLSQHTDSIIKNAAKNNLQLIARFRQIPNDKTYLNYITGFIDKENRTWKMRGLKTIVL
ncbi:MAG: hypothetical protein PHW82_08330 [Bacteroidales bacterium]|nr:hypothetical protein [Bacteroidales bacterium]